MSTTTKSTYVHHPPAVINSDYMIGQIRKLYDMFIAKEDIFALMAPDVTLRVGVTDAKPLPWYGQTFKGKDDITKGCLTPMGDCVDWHSYKILNAGAGNLNPNTLLVFVSWEGMGKKPGGKKGTAHTFHRWTFNKEGLVNTFLDFEDTITTKEIIGKIDGY